MNLQTILKYVPQPIKNYFRNSLQMDAPILIGVAALLYFGWGSISGIDLQAESFMTTSMVGDLSRLLVLMIAVRFYLAASDRLIGKEYFRKFLTTAKPKNLALYYALRNVGVLIAFALILQ